MDIKHFYALYQQQKTGALLEILRGHSRSADCRKSFLALCYELRKRGFEI